MKTLAFLLLSVGLAFSSDLAVLSGSPPSAAGAAAFRSISTMTYADRSRPVSIIPPTGIVDGDNLFLVFIVGESAEVTITPPAGFTVLQAQNIVTVSGFTVTRILAWKRASGESGNYEVEMSGTNHNCQGIMIAVSGASATTPVSSDNEGTGTTTTATGITTPSNNSLVMFIAHNWALYGAASPPSGTTPTFTEQFDSATSLIYVATGVLATAGATGNKTQANGNSSSDGWAAYLVATGP